MSITVILPKRVAAPIVIARFFVFPETAYLSCVAAHDIVAILIISAVAVVAAADTYPLNVVYCRVKRSTRHFLCDEIHTSVLVNAACSIIIVFAVGSLFADKYNFGCADLNFSTVLKVAYALSVFNYKRRMFEANDIVTALEREHRNISRSVFFENYIVILLINRFLFAVFVGIADLKVPACLICILVFSHRVKRKSLGNKRNFRRQKVVGKIAREAEHTACVIADIKGRI